MGRTAGRGWKKLQVIPGSVAPALCSTEKPLLFLLLFFFCYIRNVNIRCLFNKQTNFDQSSTVNVWVRRQLLGDLTIKV